MFTPGRAPLDELAVRVGLLAGADAAAVRRGLEADPGGFALTARQAALAPPPVPGGEPEGQAQRLAGQRRLLLVVDQFEQVFTQCPDEGQRQAFVTALGAAAGAGPGPGPESAALVVLGVRADFEARCADYPQLAGAVQDRYLVTAMTERQLRMAITEPAKTAGSRVDEDLVEVLLAEVRARQGGHPGPGVLPLLSHALDQAWRSKTGPVLTLADYERTGGLEGAVADSAQRAYDHLTPGQQAAARQVFTRLTAASSDGMDTADRATRVELTEGKNRAEQGDVAAVLEAFAGERLLTLAADSVEISHEVLLTAWPLLRDTWLTETHADRIVRTRLHNTAAEWARQSRDPSYLYAGSLLQAAAETAARASADPARNPPLGPDERDFLHASGRARTRRARRQQGLIAVLSAMVIALASVAVLAFLARQDAVRQQQDAEHQRDIAVSGELAATSETLGNANPVIARLLSVAAWRINPSSDARYAMLTTATLPLIRILDGNDGQVDSVAFSPDGKILASGGDDDTARLWDVATGSPIGNPFEGNSGGVESIDSSPDSNDGVVSVAFSPDGKTLATSDYDGTLRLWNVTTGRPIGSPLTSTAGRVWSVAFSPDGKTLATGDDDGMARLWDVATGRPIGSSLDGGPHSSTIFSVAFSPDGKTLATGALDGTLRLWDVATGRPIGSPLDGNDGAVDSVTFSPDGKTLASGDDGAVQLWDVATRSPIGSPLTSGTGGGSSVAFSPDGAILATGDDDGTVRLWDVATGSPIGSPLTSNGGVNSVAFSPDGKTLATGDNDGTVRLWDVATVGPAGGPLASGNGGDALREFGPGSTSVAFSPDGKTLAAADSDGTIQLWDAATGRPAGSPLTSSHGGVDSVAFSPDGKLLATTDGDGTVQLWNLATGRPAGVPLPADTGELDGLFGAAFSPDGKILATGDDDGTVQLWNVATRSPIGSPLTSTVNELFSMAFSPDGKILASGGGEVGTGGAVQLWDVATRSRIGSLLDDAATGPVYSVAFSPDGKTLAAGAWGGAVQLWDVATRSPIGSPLTANTGGVTSVAFSPDGETLAAGDFNGAVQLWDVTTRSPIGSPLTANTVGVMSVAFSPDGKTLASSDEEGTVSLWDVAYTSDPLGYLCAAAGHSLSRAEWRQWVPAGPAYQQICP